MLSPYAVVARVGSRQWEELSVQESFLFFGTFPLLKALLFQATLTFLWLFERLDIEKIKALKSGSFQEEKKNTEELSEVAKEKL